MIPYKIYFFGIFLVFTIRIHNAVGEGGVNRVGDDSYERGWGDKRADIY
jgi:hypothetical protein